MNQATTRNKAELITCIYEKDVDEWWADSLTKELAKKNLKLWE